MANDKYICINGAWKEPTCKHGKKWGAPKKYDLLTFAEALHRNGSIYFNFMEYPKMPCGCYPAYISTYFAPVDQYLEQYSIEELIEEPILI